jgi:hypothetical protein
MVFNCRVKSRHQNCIRILVITTLKTATRVAETCRRLLCNKITFIKPSSFVGPFKKRYVLSKFSLHFGNALFLDTKLLGVFLLRGLLRAPESVQQQVRRLTRVCKYILRQAGGVVLRETPGSMQQQNRFQRVTMQATVLKGYSLLSRH